MKKQGRICEMCGERINKDDKFCKSCGNVFINDKDAKEAIIDDPNKEKKPFEISDNVIYGILVLLAIVLVYFLVC